jgi:hypothetical protein
MAHRCDSTSGRSLKPQTLPSKRLMLWNHHNKKILRGCMLIVVPMLAFTITMLCLVFANQIDPSGCPLPDLCSNRNETNTVSCITDILEVFSLAIVSWIPMLTSLLQGLCKAYYTRASVGHLAFVSSLSASFAGFLVAAQMTLFSYVLASRLSQSGCTASNSPYAISLVIRLLNAEIPVLWNLVTRKVTSVVSNRTTSKQPPAVRLSMLMFVASLVCRYAQQSLIPSRRY